MLVNSFLICCLCSIIEPMYTIVVLGNPGPEYDSTRHNAGRVVLRQVMSRLGLPSLINSSRWGGRISEGMIHDKEVVVFYPNTYMNESGKAVKKALDAEDVQNLIVVYDEVDLPLGEFKVSVGGRDAGHNGLKSIISALGTKDFTRVRIGIAPKTLFGKVVRPRGDKLSRYVLGKMSNKELSKLEELVPRVTEAIEEVVKG